MCSHVQRPGIRSGGCAHSPFPLQLLGQIACSQFSPVYGSAHTHRAVPAIASTAQWPRPLQGGTPVRPQHADRLELINMDLWEKIL